MISKFLIVLILLCWADESRCFQTDRSVRVRILANTRIETIEFESAGSDGLTISEDGQVIAVLPADESAIVETWQGLLRVRWSRGSVPLTRCEIGGAEIIRVSAGGGRNRRYRGVFETTLDETGAGGLLVVNELDIEHYVASVLPAEYPFTELEGVKAQAIVIRTYAITASLGGKSEYSLRDDTGSQVYRGIETETELSRAVANMTAGATVLYHGSVIEAVYSSHCGGHSADNEDIWGTAPIPYLRGRKDPYDHEAPVAEWSSSADVNDVHVRLSNHFGKQVKAIDVTDRGTGKHVREVKIRFKDAPDVTMRGERFRSTLNAAVGSQLLRSSSYEIAKRSGTYHFEGRGNGHGVGFCQWGARAQAQQGRTYEEILKFYYKGVDIQGFEPEPVAFMTKEPDSQPKTKARKRRPGW